MYIYIYTYAHTHSTQDSYGIMTFVTTRIYLDGSVCSEIGQHYLDLKCKISLPEAECRIVVTRGKESRESKVAQTVPSYIWMGVNSGVHVLVM